VPINLAIVVLHILETVEIRFTVATTICKILKATKYRRLINSLFLHVKPRVHRRIALRQKTNNSSIGAANPLIFVRLASINIARIQKSA
jgi:hypothetical protein